jgi:hypothetical protein
MQFDREERRKRAEKREKAREESGNRSERKGCKREIRKRVEKQKRTRLRYTPLESIRLQYVITKGYSNLSSPMMITLYQKQ